MAYERYDLYFKIHFQIYDAGGVTVPKFERLINQLYQKLKNYVYKEKTLSCRIIDVDKRELSFGRVNAGLCEGLFQIIRFECVDTDPSEHERIHRLNDYIRGRLGQILAGWKFSHYKTQLDITRVEYG